MRAFISANAVEPAANATMYSDGLGNLGACPRAAAQSGVTGVEASIGSGVSTFWAISGFSSGSFSSGSTASGSVCSSLLPACAAIWWIRAVSNAGIGTIDNSFQTLAVITMVPLSSYLYSVGTTPTDTPSSTPSMASVSAAVPSGTSLIRAWKYIPGASPVNTSTRSVTRPIGREVSWYWSNLGARPSVGSEPGAKRTRVPSMVTASSSPYGAARPMIVRLGVSSPAAASMVTG